MPSNDEKRGMLLLPRSGVPDATRLCQELLPSSIAGGSMSHQFAHLMHFNKERALARARHAGAAAVVRRTYVAIGCHAGAFQDAQNRRGIRCWYASNIPQHAHKQLQREGQKSPRLESGDEWLSP